MHPRTNTLFAAAILLGSLLACHTSRPATDNKPPSGPGAQPAKPGSTPMDTLRWTTPTNAKPPIGEPSGGVPARPSEPAGTVYRVSIILPFLTEQFDDANPVIPEKSDLALQFYAGAKLALADLSEQTQVNLSIQVHDTHASDEEFQALLRSGKLDRAHIIIGPVRSSHVQALAGQTKLKRQILISPETPVSELTAGNPDFIQLNPSLRSHCHGIIRYVRSRHKAEDVVLVCKEKEAPRLAYFQEINTGLGGAKMRELILPDAAVNFDKTDLKPYFKPGRTTVFIMPSWASQDFVMSFLLKVKAQRGGNAVEIYGMPQWQRFENIEPEYLRDLNVHVSSADYIDHNLPKVLEFEQRFFDTYGTIPSADAFNGYETVWMMGTMLEQYGLNFPNYLHRLPEPCLRGAMQFERVRNPGSPAGDDNVYDYLENNKVHILKFDQYKFVPAED